MRRWHLAPFLIAGLTACSGGGQAVSSRAMPAANQNVSLTITLPSSGSKTQSGRRSPTAILSLTQSISIQVNSLAEVSFNVSPNSGGCTTTGGVTSCTLTVGAPVGNDTFNVATFGAQNGNGPEYDQGSTTANVTLAGPNSASVTLLAPSYAGTITEFNAPTAASSPYGLTTGPDNNIWFVEDSGPNVDTFAIGTQKFSTFVTPSGSSGEMFWIVTGPDGNLWFTEYATNKIGKITPSGTVTEYPVTTPGAGPCEITAGPDGNLWFTEQNVGQIGKITTSGVVTEYPVPSGSASEPGAILTGPDGNIWFAEFGTYKIAKSTTSGAITEYTVPTEESEPCEMVVGPDGNIWFTEQGTGKVGFVTTAGVFTEYTTPAATPIGITAAGDGNLWFVDSGNSKIAKITTSGTVTEYSTPTAEAAPAGITVGHNGFIYFTESGSNKLGMLQ